MLKFDPAELSRRDMLKTTGNLAVTVASSQLLFSKAFASEENTINLALVGCGGRGSGAVADALSIDAGPIKLKAMADVFNGNLSLSYNAINGAFENKIDVPPERKFIGFDAYKQAMDCLKPGDVVILTTPPAFRWVHFQYAIQKGLNVFMEKPVTVDGPTSKKMLDLAEQASQKNLKCGVGLMCRHSPARQELFNRIQDGEIGELNLLRAYRMHGPEGSAFVPPYTGNISEVLYQVAHFHGFLWVSGGCFSDFYIHNIDECCWMKDDFPVTAQASGGRHYRDDYVDQNFDNYSVEYTFKDGCKMFVFGRTMPNVKQEFGTYVHGSKGCAVVCENGHFPAKTRIYSGQNFVRSKLAWQYPVKEGSPYKQEWADLIDAIRNDKPYNEVPRGVRSSLVTSMGRMAAHTGQEITFDELLNGDHEFAPGLSELTSDGPAPVQMTENGKYPIPAPGLKGKREY
ncbi:Gfo/Idh/MocA family protein [Planctomicrobium sp. SH661]|uniref:Gfo/Idh/MocA family protein n=1 Tax=Planctomicrobium sp. SH661 TaxID=3448124 RepID=UPI003F5C83A5